MSGNLLWFMLHSDRGDQHVYHTGYLPVDRTDTWMVDALASHAMELFEQGRVLLFQRKYRPFLYDYIAVRL